MKKASKVFIWLGMISQFFLVYPIIVGILSLKKINRAKTKNDLQNFGIITTLFCSLLGGVFMLCIEDSDLRPFVEDVVELEEIMTKKQGTVIKKSYKALILKVLCIIGFILTFAAFITFFFLTISCVYVPWYSRVDVSKNAEVIYKSTFTVFLIFAIVFLCIAMVLHFLVFKLFKCNKKEKIIGMAIVAFICLLFPLISIPVKVTDIQSDLRSYETRKIEELERQAEELERNSLKYTDIKISELLSDVERYPTKYHNTQISLEGYAKNIKINSFDLIFPYDSYYGDNYIEINYVYDNNNPRVLQGDYVVVIGTIEVSTKYNTEITVKIINATCDIKQ